MSAFFWQYSKIKTKAPAPAEVATTTIPIEPPKVYTTYLKKDKDIFKSVSISENQIVSSDMTLSGEVRGQWYFEASFPVELRSATGTLIWIGIAQAQGDWMTTNYVPFSLPLAYTSFGTSTKATLVLKKDNPSGEKVNDDELRIPVILQ